MLLLKILNEAKDDNIRKKDRHPLDKRSKLNFNNRGKFGSIIDRLKDEGYLRDAKGTGCSLETANNAQKILHVRFPREYIEMITRFDLVNLTNVNLTYLRNGYIEDPNDVINATIMCKRIDPNFPDGFFVLSKVDNTFVLCNGAGNVFSYIVEPGYADSGKLVRIAGSIYEFIVKSNNPSAE